MGCVDSRLGCLDSRLGSHNIDVRGCHSGHSRADGHDVGEICVEMAMYAAAPTAADYPSREASSASALCLSS